VKPIKEVNARAIEDWQRDLQENQLRSQLNTSILPFRSSARNVTAAEIVVRHFAMMVCSSRQ
jgi:hypothetical protein